MEWKCHSCRGVRAFVDFKDDEPALRCLDCYWDEALDEDRCSAPCAGGWGAREGRRCGQHAVIAGLCWRHSKLDMLRSEIYDYLRRRASDDDLPQIHRLVFEEALKAARVVVADERHGEALRTRAEQLRARPERGPSVVYFIEREDLVKIGVTTDLTKRLAAIGKGSSMPPGMTIGPVVLLATESGDRKLEQLLHSKFSKTRIHGTEWFRESKALRNYIDDLRRFQQNEDHFMRRVGAA